MRPAAVILAGGLGSRMMPLTARRPKHLLPVGDEPVIGHQLRRLAAVGVTDVVLATAHLAHAFAPVLGDGRGYGVRLSYAHEASPAGTGGALRTAGALLDPEETAAVVVLNGDLLSEHDLAAHLAAHLSTGAAVTVHGRSVADASAFGLLHTIDGGSQLQRFEEKPPGSPAGIVNAGTYVVSPLLFDLLPPGVSSLERDVFPALLRRGADVRLFREDASFADIGSPRALLEANLAWADRRGLDSVIVDAMPGGGHPGVRRSLVMAGAVVADNATIDRCVIAPGARVGPKAHLVRCVVADDVTVPAGTTAADEIIV